MCAATLSPAVFLTAFFLFVANAVVQRSALHSSPRQLVHKIESAPRPIDVLAIGNSLMAAAFDEATIHQALRQCGRSSIALNGSLGATGIIEHLALARLALRHHQVRTLVYGYFDQQMVDDVPSGNSELIGNRSMLYYQEPALTDQYAHFDLLNRIAFHAYGSCALLRERGSIWGKVELLRRQMQAVGMPADETNRFGRRDDFNLLEAESTDAFDRRCQRVLDSNAFLGPPVQALLDQATQQGARVVVVAMPVHPSHSSRFYHRPEWTRFQAGTRDAVLRSRAAFLDSTQWIADESLFADHLHLSDQGAAIFSERLAKILTSNQLD